MLHACIVYTHFVDRGKLSVCECKCVVHVYCIHVSWKEEGPSTSMQVSVYTHVCIVYTHFVDGGKLSASMQV